MKCAGKMEHHPFCDDRKVVYAFYSLSLLFERGVPFVRKARVTELQMFQLLARHLKVLESRMLALTS